MLSILEVRRDDDIVHFYILLSVFIRFFKPSCKFLYCIKIFFNSSLTCFTAFMVENVFVFYFFVHEKIWLPALFLADISSSVSRSANLTFSSFISSSSFWIWITIFRSSDESSIGNVKIVLISEWKSFPLSLWMAWKYNQIALSHLNHRTVWTSRI